MGVGVGVVLLLLLLLLQLLHFNYVLLGTLHTVLWGISEAGSVSRPRPALFRSGGNLSALRSIEGGAVGVRMLSRGAARTLGGSLGPL